ncbi:hypothetical protein LINGRAHAP2_LOCUS488 [Linum grandiflorum]
MEKYPSWSGFTVTRVEMASE